MPANNNDLKPKTPMKSIRKSPEKKVGKDGLNLEAEKPKLLPNCLLREPLSPDQQQLLGPEERKIYGQ